MGFDGDQELFPFDPAFRILLVQPALGGSARQLGGHDRRADPVAMVVQGDIIKAVVAMGFAAGGAGFGGDVVRAKDGVVFGEIGELIMLHDGGSDAVDSFGDGLGRGGIEPSGRLRNGKIRVLPAAGRDQMKLRFDGFTGRLGQVGADAVGVDTAAVGPDQRRDDMNMRVVGVVMTVHQVGLIFHFKTLHIAIGNARQLLVGEHFFGRKVQRGVKHFYLRTAVQLVQALEPAELVLVRQAFFTLQKIARMDAFGFALCYFFFVVGKGFGRASDGVNSRDHSSYAFSMVVEMVLIFVSRRVLSPSLRRIQFWISGTCRRVRSWWMASSKLALMVLSSAFSWSISFSKSSRD